MAVICCERPFMGSFIVVVVIQYCKQIIDIFFLLTENGREGFVFFFNGEVRYQKKQRILTPNKKIKGNQRLSFFLEKKIRLCKKKRNLEVHRINKR